MIIKMRWMNSQVSTRWRNNNRYKENTGVQFKRATKETAQIFMDLPM